MRIITLHCDYIKFKALKKALKDAENLDVAGKEGIEVKEPLVVLTTVESHDTENEVKELVKSVLKTAGDVKAENIVLYPYAHLSRNLAAPEKAQEYLYLAEDLLSKEKVKVTRAPFGYYKEFELKCKGHPLSELSKEFGKVVEGKAKEEGKLIRNVSDKEEKYDEEQLLKQISRSKLDTSKLKDNDHRIIGQKLDLFSFNEVAPGQPFWHKNGLIIFNELVKFSRELHEKADYQEILTPQILDNKLWKVSGHWGHYKENMFISEYENKESAVKPMNCPGMMLVYKTKTRSYKDLPLRLFEFGVVHRKELSGVLAGLFRVVRITQDDAHIFCSKEQIGDEIKNILGMIKEIYKDTFGFEYSLELSTRPEKFMGDKGDWDKAEKELMDVLKKAKVKYKIKKGDGAFYGPKIDIHIKDSLKRDWQLATIQLDMQMPQRFEIQYIDKDGKAKTPIVIHRAIFGSLERFIGILLEHLNGNLPLWLSPVQCRVISFTDRNVKAAETLTRELKELGVRAESDVKNAQVSEKIRDSEMQKINYAIVIGDKEEKAKTLAVRKRGEKKPKHGVKKEKFISDLLKKIKGRN